MFFTFYILRFLFFEILTFFKHFFAIFSFIPLCFTSVGVIIIFCLFHYTCLCWSRLLYLIELGHPLSWCYMLLNTLCSLSGQAYGAGRQSKLMEWTPLALGFLKVWERLGLSSLSVRQNPLFRKRSLILQLLVFPGA